MTDPTYARTKQTAQECGEQRLLRYLKTNEAAKMLGIATVTLRTWARRKLIPCYRPTKRTSLYKVSDLEAAMDRFASKAKIGGGR